MSFIRFENVEKRYGTGDVSVLALHNASFTIERGEICVIVGPSGAGKTTLLNILGGMDTLTSGKVFLGDSEVSSFNKRRLAEYRRRDIGFVFQFYNLIPNLTAHWRRSRRSCCSTSRPAISTSAINIRCCRSRAICAASRTSRR